MPRTVTIAVEVVLRETDLALLFVIDDDEVWIPKSVIEDAETIDVGDEDIEINIASWFAEKEGLA